MGDSLFYRIFDGREPAGSYSFATKGVGLSSTQVERTFEDGKWVLRQGRHTVRSQDSTGAVLLLIAARMGLQLPGGVDFEDTPDTPEDGS
jgi:hypothetical protein